MLIQTEAALAGVVSRAGRAERLAVDVESNGLFAYRPALCVLQLAWADDGAIADGGAPVLRPVAFPPQAPGTRPNLSPPHTPPISVAVIDALAVPIASLAPVLGEAGPVKVLHDLTFDARLLAEAGAPLARVRDTSVAARLLGRRATGLSALLMELGVLLDKRLQQHDWSRRPLGAEELQYLAGDVRHLLDLDDHLERDAALAGVTAEIADECAYKLETAIHPRRDPRPGWTRIKGAQVLDAQGRAALRRLWAAREAEAEAEGVPPFRVAANDALLEMARARPRSIDELGAAGLAASLSRRAVAWSTAIAEAASDGDVPAEELALLAPPPPSSAEISRRRAREAQVSRWRRAEAGRRGVDEQAVLPGHCAADLVDALVAHDARSVDTARGRPEDRHAADLVALRAAIAAIPGLGASRLARYGELFAAFGTQS